ncbi:nucleoside-diphosphate sugar epimerase/dehydratase [Nocardioides marinquilinus]|uniref:Nucleoside-diphosphate sugar epimerase/dehydratase n=1 Tax=Nocardioides marinquilinus TaxID=1210400 RepID=A0ABP9PJ88_9ACTN
MALDTGLMRTVGTSRLPVVLRRYRLPLLLAVDSAALVLAYVGFALLRYLGTPSAVPWAELVELAVVAVVVTAGLGATGKLYQGRSAIASVDETIQLAFAVGAGTVVAQLVNVLGPGELVARTVPFGAGFAALALMVVARAHWRRVVHLARYVDDGDRTPVLVLGGGDAGRELIRSMRTSPDSPYTPVALLDDDPWKRHLRVEGVSVRGTLADLEDAVAVHQVSTVVVAIASATSELLAELAERAERLGVDLKVLPGVAELFGTRISIRDIRDINTEDLLGRGLVDTDLASIAGFLHGKRVLVTGAGGSIGAELSRQVSLWEPAELMMLDRDESALHGVQLTIHGHGLLDSDEVILCDIRDADALRRVFEERRPEVVLHAAALKHLPMLEQYPGEAIKTNVLGTVNVLEAARAVGVERFVNISTDKAADPTSVLGLSKRVAERVTADVARDASGTYMSVRFGNVLGSRGSVLTAWAAQIARGGPVTVTHPDVTRYFMTIHEACQLVLQAGAIGRDGEVMVLDMGEPVRVDDVARQLIAQSGRDIEIVYTGLREGEKLDEVLIAHGEADRRPVHDLITHVDVPAVPRHLVAAPEARADRGEALRLLRAWCEAPSPDRTPVGV